MDTTAVLDRHMAAFLAGDVEATLADYAADAVILGQRGVVSGIDEIRGMFDRIYSTTFVPGTYEFTMDVQHVDGEVAFIAWHAQIPAANITLGTDTLVVRGGKIVAQTVALRVEPTE